jgi:hypothetical protein
MLTRYAIVTVMLLVGVTGSVVAEEPTQEQTIEFLKEKLHAESVDVSYGDANYRNEEGKLTAAAGHDLIISINNTGGYAGQTFWIILEGVDRNAIRTSGSRVQVRCKNGLQRIKEQHWTSATYDEGGWTDAVSLSACELRTTSDEDATKVAKALRHLIKIILGDEPKELF